MRSGRVIRSIESTAAPERPTATAIYHLSVRQRTSFPATFMGRKRCGYVYRNPDRTLEDGNEDVAADVFDVHEFSVKQ